ncbi:hypothetical protein P3T76_008834 [Phytophthora citrophthora]|uniref:Uncharacterized protein n=1 Tax=Phytophthora citrophthora TaxID=4793 RepID=A0AAD9GHU2_9STRA|nr:hypothetical protein P3T76_015778 [Phytophthora citrophthora]KAK1936998.1 hypothetical protein P3T76_009776 [Phytophthora citrophthora]KAK1938759.1 hypothetical protein P3T76_008834 [Phytophthora citrophthora]
MANDPAAVPTLYVWMLFLRRAPAGNYHEELLPHVPYGPPETTAKSRSLLMHSLATSSRFYR